VWLEQPAVPAVIVLVGTLLLQPLARSLGPFVAAVGGVRRIDTLITGLYMPAIGILFAMLTSTAVGTLRQRQQDCRDFLNLELASVRLLSSMVGDPETILLLLEYTRALDAETFSHRANNIIYHQRGNLDAKEAELRELVFAYADDVLYTTVRRVNSLRMRNDLEGEMRDLVKLRTKRRATLDTGFPVQYFYIVLALGASILVAFLLLLASDPTWIDVPAVTWIWASLLGVFTWGGILVADLRDPFRGNVRPRAPPPPPPRSPQPLTACYAALTLGAALLPQYCLSRARMRRTLQLLGSILDSFGTADEPERV
jgi:Protein of unknown function (DUF4239)